MHVHDFSGADFEPASRYLGTCRHAAQGERSYWFGAYELCGLLSRSDHGFVATNDTGEVTGLALLASPRDEDHNRDLRMHWTQQRTVILAVSRSLSINLHAGTEDNGATGQDADGSQAAARRAVGPDAAEAVVLLVGKEEAEAPLVQSCRTWLEAHGVKVVAPAEEPASEAAVRILPSNEGDKTVVEGIIDAHAATKGVEFVPYYYHITGKDGNIEAGIVAWSLGSDVHIETLAVAEHARRKGLGSMLLHHVEEQAKRDGCTTASVDTFSFQAPDYYPAHGYEVVFRYPLDDGSEHIYFSKRL